ncbi:MAG: ATP-binding cassette domain-containing protein [Clostridium neonatale]
MNFSIKNKEKVVITGFNGIGKSTLLKTIVGEIKSLAGKVKFGENIKPGYYEQDLKWQNDGMNPIEIISDEFPKMTQNEIRKHLSQCGVKSETALQSIKSLSGGEQSKVKLCRLTLTLCNLLILDEITNHMDLASKEALKEALVSYEGTVVLVSHEASFYEDLADRIIDIEEDDSNI